MRPLLLLALLALALLALFAVPARAQSGPIQDERAAATQAAHDYVRGGDYGDLDAFRRAFHPSARLQFVRDGAYAERSLEAYLAPVTPQTSTDRQTRVTLLDLAGAAAVARVEIGSGEWMLTDYLSLLKVDGRWQIVNKIFDRSPR
jgi:hypothetical protein